IVVHLDIAFDFFQPMDQLFDAMLYPPHSTVGRKARSELQTEEPYIAIPNDIQAYITRDYHQIIPGRIPAFQAGFIVLRPNQQVFDEYVDLIREGHYVEGFGRENGWGGKGYGVVVGSMAMQGIVAYYYDHIRPNTMVELNGCRYNHMGADIKYRGSPGWLANRKDLHGRCRNGREYCEDCMNTSMALIKSVHYTNCRKPWNCAGEVFTKEQPKSEKGIDISNTNFDHCMLLHRRWHEYRTQFEDKLYALTRDATIMLGRRGHYKANIFQGHCDADHEYLAIHALPSSFSQAHVLYG
ncbi:MAG: hypothetical protein ACRDL7_15215, partial [Gaiellaceae bacterium]